MVQTLEEQFRKMAFLCGEEIKEVLFKDENKRKMFQQKSFSSLTLTQNNAHSTLDGS